MVPGLLQVLLPLLLALAALHGHLEQPPAPHAQPEEQGIQLEQMDPRPLKGQRRSPPTLEAARQGEHACRTSALERGRPALPGTGISL